jgi:acyl-homoserine lactone acylase PvdQ
LALDSASVKPDNKKYYTAIKTWNYVNDAGSMGAVIYEAWFRLFSSAVWDELISTTPMQYEYPQAYTLIKIFKTYPNHAIFDNKHTQKIETARDLLAESFSSVCVELRT